VGSQLAGCTMQACYNVAMRQGSPSRCRPAAQALAQHQSSALRPRLRLQPRRRPPGLLLHPPLGLFLSLQILASMRLEAMPTAGRFRVSSRAVEGSSARACASMRFGAMPTASDCTGLEVQKQLGPMCVAAAPTDWQAGRACQ